MGKISVCIEFPRGDVKEFKEGKRNPTLNGYTVKSIDNRRIDDVVRIYNENENGEGLHQTFVSVPHVFYEDDDALLRWQNPTRYWD